MYSLIKKRTTTKNVKCWEISFPGLKAQIPGLVRVSIWTVVIRLAKQWQQVCPGYFVTGAEALAARWRR